MQENGKLIIIGGAEDKQGECQILKEVAKAAGTPQGRIVIITTATQKPREAGKLYVKLFKDLGVEGVEVINIESRQDAGQQTFLRTVEKATCIFFTGGDQLRITSILGGTAMGDKLKQLYYSGITIAGTSAGASAMSSTMIITGNEEDSPKKCTVKMAPGLDLLKGCVIDQHFAQRGRIGRLLCAVAQNPHVLGIGIDEDTAIVVEGNRFRVAGSQAVTVVDGRLLSFSNVSETKPDDPLALMGIVLHVLPKGYGFDLANKKPINYQFWEDRNEDTGKGNIQRQEYIQSQYGNKD
jgi:cyanophycinase